MVLMSLAAHAIYDMPLSNRVPETSGHACMVFLLVMYTHLSPYFIRFLGL